MCGPARVHDGRYHVEYSYATGRYYLTRNGQRQARKRQFRRATWATEAGAYRAAKRLNDELELSEAIAATDAAHACETGGECECGNALTGGQCFP